MPNSFDLRVKFILGLGLLLLGFVFLAKDIQAVNVFVGPAYGWGRYTTETSATNRHIYEIYDAVTGNPLVPDELDVVLNNSSGSIAEFHCTSSCPQTVTLTGIPSNVQVQHFSGVAKVGYQTALSPGGFRLDPPSAYNGTRTTRLRVYIQPVGTPARMTILSPDQSTYPWYGYLPNITVRSYPSTSATQITCVGYGTGCGGPASSPFPKDVSVPWVPVSQGYNQIGMKLFDNLGFRSSDMYGRFYYDTTLPTATCSMSGSGATRNFTTTASDSHSGVRQGELQVSDNGGAYTTFATPLNATTPFTGAGGHSYVFRYRVTDNAVNSSGGYTQTSETSCGSFSLPADFSVTITGPTNKTRTIEQGEATSFVVTVSSINYTGTVNLSTNLTGGGITSNFSPASVDVTPGSSSLVTMNVTTQLTTPPETYNTATDNFTVTGTSGSNTRSDTGILIVTIQTDDPWVKTSKGNVSSESGIDMTSAIPGTGSQSPVTITLEPTGVGGSTQWTTQFPSTGSHWDKVDEGVADEDTSYIRSTTDGQVDVFTHAPSGIPAGATITNVTAFARARFVVSSTNNIVGPAIRTSNGNVYWGDRVITNAYANYNSSWATNPSTNVVWTITDINNLQFGVRKSYSGADVRVTQVWLQVTYTPATVNNFNVDYLVLANSAIDNFSSAKGWLIEDYQSTGGLVLPKPNIYADFYSRYTIGSCAWAGTTGELPAAKGVFTISGNYTVSAGISGGTACGGTKNATVIFVNGTLTISTNIQSTPMPLVLIARDGITVNSNVTQVDAFLITDGNFTDSVGNQPLVINGGLVAAMNASSQISLLRDLGVGNSTAAAETINLVPRYFFLLSDLLGTTASKTDDLAP